jgi:DNA-binding beta-propeller fold protein YncE
MDFRMAGALQEGFSHICSKANLYLQNILHRKRFMKISIVAVAALFLPGPVLVSAQTGPPLKLQKTIALPSGTGKFDHFAIDLKANRLFIASTGNHSVEVLDLGSEKVTENLRGLGKPHGVAWIPDSEYLYASDGLKGDLKLFDGRPFKLAQSIGLSEDADDMVYDAKSRLLYVGHGGSDANPARIAVVDSEKLALIADIPVESHPEGLELDPIKDRIFVNIADAAQVVVIDGATHKQSAVWKLTRAKDNVPLAYDAQHQLLFVACRTPARLLVLDGNTGVELADLPSDSGADDLFYDPVSHRIYLIAGAGAVDMYKVDPDKTVRAAGVVRTAAGAKTGLLVSSQHTLYVGVPASSGKEAEIFLYSIP